MISERRSKIIIGIEAALIVVAVHALVTLLAGYRAESAAPHGEAPRSSATLFDLAELTPDERRKFDIWVEVNDPAQFLRSDGKRGFLSGHKEPELRDYTNRRPRLRPPASAETTHPAVTALRELNAGTRLPEEFNAISGVRVPASAPPFVRVLDSHWQDVEGVAIAVPATRPASKLSGPSVIAVTPVDGSNGVCRMSLRSSCGDHVRDKEAQTAIFKARRSGTISDGVFYVFWSEPQEVAL